MGKRETFLGLDGDLAGALPCPPLPGGRWSVGRDLRGRELDLLAFLDFCRYLLFFLGRLDLEELEDDEDDEDLLFLFTFPLDFRGELGFSSLLFFFLIFLEGPVSFKTSIDGDLSLFSSLARNPAFKSWSTCTELPPFSSSSSVANPSLRCCSWCCLR